MNRVVSSAGRATRLHRVGRGFEPLTTHHSLYYKNVVLNWGAGWHVRLIHFLVIDWYKSLHEMLNLFTPNTEMKFFATLFG